MKSLKDQLLKAGLTDANAVKNTRKQKPPKQAKKFRGLASESARQAEQILRDKTDRDKALNRQRQLEIEEKARLAQIRQLIAGSKIERDSGELSYNFTAGGIIKTLQVTAEQQQQLIRNQIAIVTANKDAYELVPKIVANKIAQRNPACVVSNPAPQAVSAVDDPYADYQIPDDLIW